MSDESDALRLVDINNLMKSSAYHGQSRANLAVTEVWVKLPWDEVQWLRDQLLSAWGLLADMQADEGYRRGIMDGLRMAREALEAEGKRHAARTRDFGQPDYNRALAAGAVNALAELVSKLAALGPAAPPLPPDALLAGYVKMREALKGIMAKGAWGGAGGWRNDPYVIAREALGEQP